MDLARKALDVFLHLDRHLNTLAGDLGGWFYGLLCPIVFCETGLVVTPFLPGDSLLFAVGALATRLGSAINLSLVSVLLCVAYSFSAASPEPFVKMMRPMNASAPECVSFVSIETTTAWGFSGSSPKTFL